MYQVHLRFGQNFRKIITFCSLLTTFEVCIVVWNCYVNNKYWFKPENNLIYQFRFVEIPEKLGMSECLKIIEGEGGKCQR